MNSRDEYMEKAVYIIKEIPGDRLKAYSSAGSMRVPAYTYVYDAAAGIVTVYKDNESVIEGKEIIQYYLQYRG